MKIIFTNLKLPLGQGPGLHEPQFVKFLAEHIFMFEKQYFSSHY